MPRKYQRKRETKYKVEDVKNAIEDVKSKKYTLSQASTIYAVPKSTLHDCMKKEGKETKSGKNAVFTLEQEKVLEEHIIKCGKHFDVITKDIVRKVAFKFANVNKIKHNFDIISQMAGKDWYYGYRKRHPNIEIRPRCTSISVNEVDMRMFFNNWESLHHISANVLCKSVYNDDKVRISDVQKQFGLRPRRRRNTKTTTRTDSESSSSETYNPKRLAVLCEKVLKKYKLLPAETTPPIDPSDYFVVGGNAIKMEVVARPYSNAERQRRYREKRKADKTNACTTFSQSSDVQPQQNQLQHDDQNKRTPQSNAERQRKYRKLLRKRQQEQQQMGHNNAITVLSSPEQAARKRHLNKLRQSRFRARQRFESTSTSSHQAQAERPLRKRKEPVPEESKDKKRKTTHPDGTQIKKRGRPKSQKEVKETASGRPSSKKLEMELFTFTPASDNTDFEEESVIIKMEELDIPPDNDPFGEEKADFFADIKEEFPYNEDNEEKNIIAETNILMPTLVPTLKPGQPSTSKVNTGAVPVISVILDDIQIFANSVAEQLRAMPVHRALLLQLDIQNMLDNEKQIMMHES